MVPGRAAALCQPESGALQPDVGSACADIIIEKASSEDRRGHSPQTPRGGTPQGGKQHTGKPTRQHFVSVKKRQHRARLFIVSLHVEYAERSIEYGIRFIFSPVYEYSNLEYEHVLV